MSSNISASTSRHRTDRQTDRQHRCNTPPLWDRTIASSIISTDYTYCHQSPCQYTCIHKPKRLDRCSAVCDIWFPRTTNQSRVTQARKLKNYLYMMLKSNFKPRQWYIIDITINSGKQPAGGIRSILGINRSAPFIVLNVEILKCSVKTRVVGTWARDVHASMQWR